jgi:hypothetical protein
MNPDTLRTLGPAGLTQYLSTYGARASRTLDALCAQKDAHTSLLYWFTSLPLAIAEARRTGRPILSLRLLGRLDEDRSCANSRFFRKQLYPDVDVAEALREGWVLHWQTVREAPRITVDFGNGRRIERTITGNSGHLVLDVQGRMVDALPGLYSAEAFTTALREVRPIALKLGVTKGEVRARALEHWHCTAGEKTRTRWAAALNAAPASLATLSKTTSPAQFRALGGKSPTAREAGALAVTKLRVEMPLLNALERDTAEDTGRNEYLLRGQVHEAFEHGIAPSEPDAFTEWLYETVFLMPSADPWLGLAPDDAFSGLDGEGLITAERRR